MLGAVDSKSKALYAMQLSKGRAGDGGLSSVAFLLTSSNLLCIVCVT